MSIEATLGAVEILTFVVLPILLILMGVVVYREMGRKFEQQKNAKRCPTCNQWVYPK